MGWPKINIEIYRPDGTPLGVASALLPNVSGCHTIRAPALISYKDQNDESFQLPGRDVNHTATVVMQLDLLFACMRSNGMGPESWETLETVP